MSELLNAINVLVLIYMLVMLARVLMTWVPMFTGRPLDPDNPIVKFLLIMTEPLLAPVRRFTTFGMIDLSPMVVLFALVIIREVLSSAAQTG